jgi:nitrogen-specific signal transduction histidine kinase
MGRGALDDSIAPSNVLGQQIGSFAGSPFSEILDGLPVAVIVLNAFGQIVYSNPAFEILIGNEASSEMLGTRLGEALGCIHCRGRNIRCGITDFCRYCGGSVSFLSSSGGNTRIEECRITRTRNGREESLDLKVWSKTLSHSGEDFVLSCLIDASDEKRRRVLERAFFHDILNIASGLKVTYDVLLKDTLPAAVKEKITALGAGTQQLVEEIQLQKDLTAAEKNQLLPHWECVETGSVLRDIKVLYENHPVARARRIDIDDDSVSVDLETDPILLKRVIGNMVKNALEATAEGGTVSLRCRVQGKQVLFSVRNRGQIAEDVQLQIFKRSYSTKGGGRGIGTYSMKLLAERYLQGKVSFLSNGKEGTVFEVSLPLQPSAPSYFVSKNDLP